jgi:hypothetical protein
MTNGSNQFARVSSAGLTQGHWTSRAYDNVNAPVMQWPGHRLTCSSKLRRSKLKPLPVTTARRMSRGPPRKLENWVSMMDTLLARDSGITLTTLACCDLPAIPVSCHNRSEYLDAIQHIPSQPNFMSHSIGEEDHRRVLACFTSH